MLRIIRSIYIIYEYIRAVVNIYYHLALNNCAVIYDDKAFCVMKTSFMQWPNRRLQFQKLFFLCFVLLLNNWKTHTVRNSRQISVASVEKLKMHWNVFCLSKFSISNNSKLIFFTPVVSINAAFVYWLEDKNVWKYTKRNENDFRLFLCFYTFNGMKYMNMLTN